MKELPEQDITLAPTSIRRYIARLEGCKPMVTEPTGLAHDIAAVQCRYIDQATAQLRNVPSLNAPGLQKILTDAYHACLMEVLHCGPNALHGRTGKLNQDVAGSHYTEFLADHGLYNRQQRTFMAGQMYEYYSVKFWIDEDFRRHMFRTVGDDAVGTKANQEIKAFETLHSLEQLPAVRQVMEQEFTELAKTIVPGQQSSKDAPREDTKAYAAMPKQILMHGAVKNFVRVLEGHQFDAKAPGFKGTAFERTMAEEVDRYIGLVIDHFRERRLLHPKEYEQFLQKSREDVMDYQLYALGALSPVHSFEELVRKATQSEYGLYLKQAGIVYEEGARPSADYVQRKETLDTAFRETHPGERTDFDIRMFETLWTIAQIDTCRSDLTHALTDYLNEETSHARGRG